MTGIDFMAVATGRQKALDDNWQDRLRAEQSAEFNYNAEGRAQQGVVRQQAFDKGQAEQEAAFFLAPMTAFRQKAADSGIPADQFLIDYRQSIMNDPNFQSKAPEVQRGILEQLGVSAALEAQSLLAQGNPESTAKGQALLRTFGATGQINSADTSFTSGDIPGFLKARGVDIGTDGRVDVGGVKMSPLQAADALRTRGQGGLWAYAAQIQAQDKTKTELQKTLDKQKLDEFNSRYASFAAPNSGLIRVGSDTWAYAERPTVPAFRLNPLEGLVPLQAPLGGMPPAASPVTGAPVAGAMPTTGATPAQQLTATPGPNLNAQIVQALPLASPEIRNEWQAVAPALNAARTLLTQNEQSLERLKTEFQSAVAAQDNAKAAALAPQIQQVTDAQAELTRQKTDLNSRALDLQEKILSRKPAIDFNSEMDAGSRQLLKALENPETAKGILAERPIDAARMLQALYVKQQEVQLKLKKPGIEPGKKVLLEDFAQKLDTAISAFGLK